MPPPPEYYVRRDVRKVLSDLKTFVSVVACNKGLKGFTLAEVLITLGIIGIVAALTMPSLIAEHRKKVLAAQAKHFYSILSQAFSNAEFHNGDAIFWESDSEKTIFEQYLFPELKGKLKDKDTAYWGTNTCKEHLRTSKLSYTVREQMLTMSAFKGCFQLAGGEVVFPLKEGVSTSTQWEDTPDYEYRKKVKAAGLIVDVNGLKKPNESGKDIFAFMVVMKPFGKNITGCANHFSDYNDIVICDFYNPGIYPSGYGRVSSCQKGTSGLNTGITNMRCTGKLVSDGWEFTKDYPW